MLSISKGRQISDSLMPSLFTDFQDRQGYTGKQTKTKTLHLSVCLSGVCACMCACVCEHVCACV